MDAQLFDSFESQRAPDGARDDVFDRDVQTDLGQAALSAPADPFVEECLQDTHPPLARNHISRRHIAIGFGEKQRGADGMNAAQYSHRSAVAPGEQDDLIRRLEVCAVKIARPPGRVRVQALEQRIRLVLAQQRQPERDNHVEIGNGGGTNFESCYRLSGQADSPPK